MCVCKKAAADGRWRGTDVLPRWVTVHVLTDGAATPTLLPPTPFIMCSTHAVALHCATCHFAKRSPSFALAGSSRHLTAALGSPHALSCRRFLSRLTCCCWCCWWARARSCVSLSEQIVPSASILLELQKSRPCKRVHELPGNSGSVIAQPVCLSSHYGERWPSPAGSNVFMELRKS